MSEVSNPDIAGAMTAQAAALFKADNKFLRGKNGRLFLANDANRVLAQHCGEMLFSNDEVAAWRHTLESRAAWLEHTVGASYILLVPPNAHSVYPEDLPDDVYSAPRRPVHQLLSHVEETGSFARVVYPLADLVAAKCDELPVYPRTNTHWSDYGQYLAYRRVMEEVRARVPVDEVPRSAVDFSTVEDTGDLGYKTQPPETSLHVSASVRDARARLVFDNCVRNTGSMVVTESDADTEARCLVLGDSYSYRMLPFLAPVFRRLVFAHTSALEFELAEDERPDVVISVMSERFLMVLPHDAIGPTTRQIAGWKLGAGEVRHRLLDWPEAEPET